MSNKLKKYNPEFKAKVALAALRNEQTLSVLSQRFGVHPNMISVWKKVLVDNAADTFDKAHKSRKKVDDQIDELHRQIGQLKVELIFYHANSASKAQTTSGHDRCCRSESEYIPTMPSVEYQSINLRSYATA